ncbi:uncharacterized protein F5Z01DRAFT_113914 [Emericellopsis atlantica]|uniref:Secreted protein n=1 Tax=Emericellopsis atlantica TaxID=2614577 RepID=A0A9P7ZLT8_9HYPO|nr:uncharacterized protein F5Z01DRAFT_113914 [Emericellopsis atlantica]KAG9254046.1 hypothetical protein F5Z01DRAFT_113914 [Emericellopsis atlantica]
MWQRMRIWSWAVSLANAIVTSTVHAMGKDSHIQTESIISHWARVGIHVVVDRSILHSKSHLLDIHPYPAKG